LARRYASPAFAALAKGPFVALAGWIAFSALTSYDPATSLKRAALCLLVSASAAMAPLLPRGRSEMAQLIAIAAAIPLALSYLGVLLMPDLAIHSAADSLEPDLAGAWRGVFAHKNIASPAVGFFAYFGLYLIGEGRRWQGFALAGASVVFLLFTHGKTSTALWLPALLIGFFGARTRASWLFAALALGPAIAISALGFGAQMSEPLKNLAALLPFDSSFTGRADVWKVAAEKIPERLVLGHGFDAFWDDPALRSNAENGWTVSAAHAHNGYADATLAMGLIGLALTLWALVLQPLADIFAARRRGGDLALTTLCAQIWVYGVWVSSLETFFFDRANPIWFLFLFAVFTLRYLATFSVAP
jgi:O-antigen ligase